MARIRRNTVRACWDNNPHVKFYNAQRGYVSNTISKEQWRADYKVLPRVTVAGDPISTRASYVVEAGVAGAKPA